MFTPNDIANKKFDKCIGFGYKIEEVEDYLAEIASYVEELTEDKKDLEKKLEILADKLEEYRNDEDSLRAALLGAQKLGDGVIRESKTKAEIIMRDASIKAEKMVDSAKRQIEQEQLALSRMQKEVAAFKSRLIALYKQHLELISALPDAEDKKSAPAEAAPKKDTAPEAEPRAEREETVQENTAPVSEPAPAAPAEEERRPAPEREAERVPRSPSSAAREGFQMAFHGEEADDEVRGDYEDRREPEAEPAPERNESRFGALRFGEGFGLKRENEGFRKH